MYVAILIFFLAIFLAFLSYMILRALKNAKVVLDKMHVPYQLHVAQCDILFIRTSPSHTACTVENGPNNFLFQLLLTAELSNVFCISTYLLLVNT